MPDLEAGLAVVAGAAVVGTREPLVVDPADRVAEDEHAANPTTRAIATTTDEGRPKRLCVACVDLISVSPTRRVGSETFIAAQLVPAQRKK